MCRSIKYTFIFIAIFHSQPLVVCVSVESGFLKNKIMSKIERMEAFLDWFQNRIQSVHKLTNEQFISILNKI